MLRAFLVGTALVRKHFGDDVSLRELYSRFMLVNMLLEQDAVTVGELSNATGIPLATTSRFTYTCLAEGCMRESIDPDDRRRRLLKITSYGVDKMRSFADDWLEMMGGPMPNLEEFLKLNPA